MVFVPKKSAPSEIKRDDKSELLFSSIPKSNGIITW
jgi:hypothetical protein